MTDVMFILKSPDTQGILESVLKDRLSHNSTAQTTWSAV